MSFICSPQKESIESLQFRVHIILCHHTPFFLFKVQLRIVQLCHQLCLVLELLDLGLLLNLISMQENIPIIRTRIKAFAHYDEADIEFYYSVEG